MKIPSSRFFIFLWSGLLILGVLCYFFLIRDLITQLYNGHSPSWFAEIIHAVYPRFAVEKQRFELDFFLQKANQLVFRFVLVNLVGMILIYLYQYSQSFREKMKDFWHYPTNTRNIAIIRKLFFGILMYHTWDWVFILLNLGKASTFYQPIWLYKIAGLGFPSDTAIILLYAAMLVGAVLAFFNIRIMLFSILSIFIFLLLQGYIYSFQKLDHTYASFTYIALLMPFLLLETKNQSKESVYLQAIRLVVCLVYMMAGLEKILVGGIDWFSAQNFKLYANLLNAEWGIWLAQYEWLCSFLLWMTVIFELGFILVLFIPKLKYIFIIGGIFFHWSTYIFLGVGGWLSPWVLCYVFLVDWNKKNNFGKK